MPAAETLTNKAVQAAIRAAVASGKASKTSDGGGLVLDARPTGSGWWRFRYWMDGREGMLSLGTYPEVSLKEARQRRDDAKKQVTAGVDPSDTRKAAKAARDTQAKTEQLAAEGKPIPGTFEAVAREWLLIRHQPMVSAGHSDRTLIRFEQDIFPWLGNRPIDRIEAPELLEALRRVTGRGAIETAHRIKDSCSQVFRFGIASGYCKSNPAADLRDALPPVPTRHFAAIVDPKQASDLLQAMLGYKGNPVKGGLIKKVAKNHQFLGVNKSIARLIELRETEKKERKRLGVFWHTQGSGKSLSMVFFTQKVLRKVLGSCTFVVVTDREELDDQISKTFKATGATAREDVRATSGEHLKELLRGNERYIFTLIQKFRNEPGQPYPMLSDRSDVIVITDEAHRSQYDVFALNMRNALHRAAPAAAAERQSGREVQG